MSKFLPKSLQQFLRNKIHLCDTRITQLIVLDFAILNENGQQYVIINKIPISLGQKSSMDCPCNLNKMKDYNKHVFNLSITEYSIYPTRSKNRETCTRGVQKTGPVLGLEVLIYRRLFWRSLIPLNLVYEENVLA